MPDVPDNRLQSVPPVHEDSTLQTLRSEIETTEAANRDKSILRKAIDLVSSPYHHSNEALEHLKELNAPLSTKSDDVAAAIAANRSARQKEQDAYSVVDAAAKSLGLFTPGRFGFLAATSVFALDEAKPASAHMATAVPEIAVAGS